MVMRGMVAAFTLAAAVPAAAQSVTIDTGRLQGSAQDGVTAFLGIPYAAAPVGALRWRAPQRPARWAGVRDAMRPGPSCPQVLSSPTQLSPLGETSEDCLFLNVTAPAARGTKRPVMVWVHGGGFIAGSGSEAHFDGRALARRGVILVTVNYRLGRLGFFAHPALEAEQKGEARGNYGLMDQIAALQWVKRNIAAFGGDPNNVTLFGQSAGGISTLMLTANRQARGLFHKAIILSGTTLQPPRDIAVDRPDKPAALTLGKAWARRITGEANPTAATLRALPVEKIAPPAPAMADVMELLAAASPMMDGQLIVESPWTTLTRDGVRVPLIVGSTSRDTLVWSFADGKAQTFPFWSPPPNQIPANITDRAGFAADLLFGAGAFRLAELAARGRGAWLYHFDTVPAPLRATIDGSPHGTELFYAFGTLDRFPYHPEQIDADDRKVSDAMLDFFTAFAKSGKPASPAIWPTFTGNAPRYMHFTPPEVRAVPVSDAAALRSIVQASNP
ncbi:hypothetical protein ACFB49_09160 [Sphingomonas sp. DBB INV C78]|uniref:carboxylesterase/lipase family protein n=1 Tax=Sphingomonas sp. DBB INV C78 TaxID=3349434 RepID=UPI0036D389C9